MGISVVHSLDPRAKIISLVVLLIAMVFINTPLEWTVVTIILLSLMIVAKLPVKKLLPVFKTSGVFLFALIGAYLLTRPFPAGLFYGLAISAKLLVAIMLSTILAQTSSPQELAWGLGKLLTIVRLQEKNLTHSFIVVNNSLPVFFKKFQNRNLRSLPTLIAEGLTEAADLPVPPPVEPAGSSIASGLPAIFISLIFLGFTIFYR